jgi:thiol-disulfide isomerase/thioredoxin
MVERTREDSVSGVAYALGGAALIVALLLAFAWLPRLIHARSSEQIGRDAPNVKLPLVLNAADLTEPPALPPTAISIDELKGHAVLLDFWATWCGPCQAEAPIVDRVATRFKSRGLVVIGVNTSDEEGHAAPWATQHKISYPIAFDADNGAARSYDVDSLPTIIVISKTGKVIARRTGMTDSDELEKLVNQAL